MAQVQRIAPVMPPRADLGAVAADVREETAENAKRNAIQINRQDAENAKTNAEIFNTKTQRLRGTENMVNI